RVVDRSRRARGRRAGSVGILWPRQGRRAANHVLRLRGARVHRRLILFPPSPRRGERRNGAASDGFGPVAPDGLQAGRTLQPGFVRRRLHRSIHHGALAVRTIRSFACRSERVLLLVKRSHRLLLSGGRAPRQALRSRQYHGVYTYPFERLPHSCSVFAQPHDRVDAAARALGALADGRADAHVLRDGGGDAARANGGRERHRRSTQLGLVDQSGDVRRLTIDLVCRIAACRLRRLEDRLPPVAVILIPPHQAAGGERAAAVNLPAVVRSYRGAICSIQFTTASILASLLKSECVSSHSSRESSGVPPLAPSLRRRESRSAITQGSSDRPRPASTASSRPSASLTRTAAIL